MRDPLPTSPMLDDTATTISNLLDPLPPVLHVGTLNLLAGASGVGKTALVAYMVKQFLDCAPIFGHQPNRVPKVAYIGLDRPWTGDAERWFQKVGLTDLPHYALLDDPSYPLDNFISVKPGAQAEIAKEFLLKLDLPPGSVVVIDPVALLLGTDMNNYVRIALGCINLYRIIREMQICVIGIDHSSKQKNDSDSRYARLQDRIGGSMAKLGYTATQMYLAGPAETGQDYHTFLWNPHHAPRQEFHLKQDPLTGLFSPLDFRYEQLPPEEETTTDAPPAPAAQPSPENDPALEAMLSAWTPDVTLSLGQLQRIYADTPRRTLERRLKLLIDAAYVSRPSHGFYRRVK